MTEEFNLCSSGIEDTAKVQAELDNNTKRWGKEREEEKEQCSGGHPHESSLPMCL